MDSTCLCRKPRRIEAANYGVKKSPDNGSWRLFEAGADFFQPSLGAGFIQIAARSAADSYRGDRLIAVRAFSQQRTIIEHKSWYVAQRVHLVVVAASFNDFGVLVYLDSRESALQAPHASAIIRR